VDLIAVSAAGQAEITVAGSVYAGLPSVAGEIANRTRLAARPGRLPGGGPARLAGWAPTSFRVEVGGQAREFAGYAVVVANSAYFGAGMKVAPLAEIDDGLLDVLVMTQAPRLAFLRCC